MKYQIVTDIEQAQAEEIRVVRAALRTLDEKTTVVLDINGEGICYINLKDRAIYVYPMDLARVTGLPWIAGSIPVIDRQKGVGSK